MADTIKLHARVTREIEVSKEMAEKLVNYLCESSDNKDISCLQSRFKEGIDAGNYEAGYIPVSWIVEDLRQQDGELCDYLENNMTTPPDDGVDL